MAGERDWGAEDFDAPLTIGRRDLDRLRSILGTNGEPRERPIAARRATPRATLDDRSTTELLRDIDGKLDKVLEGGGAIDDLRADIAHVSDQVGALTELLLEVLRARTERTGTVRVTIPKSSTRG